MSSSSRSATLLAFPFRIFFLLTGLYGAMVIPAWLGLLFAGSSLSVEYSPLHWHSHEMLFGLVPAAITGFVLTAVCNWTGAPPIKGTRLLALALIWLSGRVVLWNATHLSPFMVAAVDLLFLPVLATCLFRVLRKYGNQRNLILVVVIGLLFIGNLCMHLGFIQKSTRFMQLGEIIALDVITLVMVIIAGRITPAFTTNWLRLNKPETVGAKTVSLVENFSVVTTALMLPIDIFWGNSALVGFLALAACLANAVRLVNWAGWKTLSEPLLWILHLGYLWIVVALFVKAMAAFNLAPPTAWQHALGTGAMATLILGVMTRVVLGHTGRPLQLPRFATLIYASITLAALFRLMAAFPFVEYQAGLLIAGFFWTLAFLVFTLIYWPLLSQPRVDGRPG